MASPGKIIMQVLLQGAERIQADLAKIGKSGEAAFEGIKSGAASGSAAFKEIDDSTKKIQVSVSQVGTTSTEAAAGIDNISRSTAQAGSGLSGLGSAAATAVVGLAAIGTAVAGITAGLFAYAKSGADAINATTEIATATGSTVKQIAGLEFALKAMGVEGTNTGNLLRGMAATISEATGQIAAKAQTDANASVDAWLRMRNAAVSYQQAIQTLAQSRLDDLYKRHLGAAQQSIETARALNAVYAAQIERTRALEAVQAAAANSTDGLVARLRALEGGYRIAGGAAWQAALTAEQFRLAIVATAGDAGAAASGITVIRGGFASVQKAAAQATEGIRLLRGGILSAATESKRAEPSLIQTWDRLFDSISKIQDPLERVRRVQDALKGKVSVGLINAFAEGIVTLDEFRAKAQQLGFIPSKEVVENADLFDKNLRRASLALEGLRKQSQANWIGPFAVLLGIAADALERFATVSVGGDENVSKIEKVKQAFSGLRDVVLNVAGELGKAFKEIFAGDEAFGNATFADRLALKIKDAFHVLLATGRELVAFWRRAVIPAFVAIGIVFDDLVQRANRLFGTDFTTRAVAITAIVLGLTGVFGLLGKAIAPIIAIIGGVIGAFGLLGTAVAGLGILLFWDQFKRAGEEAWRSLTAGAASFQEALNQIKVGNLAGALDAFRRGIETAWADFKRNVQEGNSTFGEFGKAIVSTVAIVRGALKTLAFVINTIFGTDISARAAGIILAIFALSGGFTALGGAALFLKFAFSAAGASVLLLGAALIRLATLFPDISASWEDLKKSFSQGLGGDFTGALESLKRAFGGFFENLKNASGATWALLAAGGLLAFSTLKAAAIGASAVITPILGFIVVTIGRIAAGLVGVLVPAIAAVARGLVLLGAAAWANPILLAIAAIALALGGLVFAVDWTKAKQEFLDGLNFIRDKWNGLKVELDGKPVSPRITSSDTKSVFDDLVDSVRSKWLALKVEIDGKPVGPRITSSDTASVLDDLITALRGKWEAFKAYLAGNTAIPNVASDISKSRLEQLVAELQAGWKGFLDYLSGNPANPATSQAVKSNFQVMIEDLMGAWQKFLDWLQGKPANPPGTQGGATAPVPAIPALPTDGLPPPDVKDYSLLSSILGDIKAKYDTLSTSIANVFNPAPINGVASSIGAVGEQASAVKPALDAAFGGVPVDPLNQGLATATQSTSTLGTAIGALSGVFQTLKSAFDSAFTGSAIDAAAQKVSAVGEQATAVKPAIDVAFNGGAVSAFGQNLQTVTTNTTAVGTESANTQGIVVGAFDAMTSATTGLQTALDAIKQKLSEITVAANQARAATDGLDAGGGGDEAGFARGGPVRGKGTSRSDSILAWLSNGEYVIPAHRVREYGLNFFERIKAGMFKFADGGMVGAPQLKLLPIASPSGGGGGGPRNILNLTIDGQKFSGLEAPRDTFAQLSRYAISQQLSSTGRKPSWYR